VITEVVSQNNCIHEKGDEDWDCLDVNDKFQTLHFTTGRGGDRWPGDWVRPTDSIDVVTKKKQFLPFQKSN
jgi:hypothetical protein